MESAKWNCLKLALIFHYYFIVLPASEGFSIALIRILYCIVLPASVFFPEVPIPIWRVIYVPTVITVSNVVGTPSSIPLLVFWVFFENVMSMLQLKAACTGLFELGKVD